MLPGRLGNSLCSKFPHNFCSVTTTCWSRWLCRNHHIFFTKSGWGTIWTFAINTVLNHQKRDSLLSFSNKLKDKNQNKDQQNQAANEISIFYEIRWPYFNKKENKKSRTIAKPLPSGSAAIDPFKYDSGRDCKRFKVVWQVCLHRSQHSYGKTQKSLARYRFGVATL